MQRGYYWKLTKLPYYIAELRIQWPQVVEFSMNEHSKQIYIPHLRQIFVRRNTSFKITLTVAKPVDEFLSDGFEQELSYFISTLCNKFEIGLVQWRNVYHSINVIYNDWRNCGQLLQFINILNSWSRWPSVGIQGTNKNKIDGGLKFCIQTTSWSRLEYWEFHSPSLLCHIKTPTAPCRSSYHIIDRSEWYTEFNSPTTSRRPIQQAR